MKLYAYLASLLFAGQVANAEVRINVRNNCPDTLWIHAAGKEATLLPDDAQLNTGTTQTYVAPDFWTSGRIEAYKNGPRQKEIEKVEMTFDKNLLGEQVLNYNVTYVDWVGLPVEVSSVGTGSDCRPSGCNKPSETILDGCPAHLRDGDRCLSARTFCLDPRNGSDPFCQAFDSKIEECANLFGDCAGARGSTTAEVYACSGPFFSQNPKYCAAINRGMLKDPMSTDNSSYHKELPYNTYSKWAHETCPGIYALAYDDFPAAAQQSGFRACTNGTEVTVTFCPAG